MADELEILDETQQLRAKQTKSDLDNLEKLTQESDKFRRQRETASGFALPAHGNHDAGLKPVIVYGYWETPAQERATFGANCPKAKECMESNGPTIQFMYVPLAGWRLQK